jgi:putative oxidoreductase
MDRILGGWSDKLYALMRIVFGALFAFHGAQKLFGAFGGEAQSLLSLMGIGGVVELVGGILVALGVRASWAAFVCSGQMAVAYFLFHLPRGWLPIANGGELAALYAWAFLYIASRGSGVWSVDGARRS